MLKWKRSLTVLAMTALLGTKAACGGNNGNGNGATNKAESTSEPASTPAAATAAPSSEPVKLRIMWWGSQPRHEATLAALDLYTKNNPNVTFEPEYSGMDGYLDKLSTRAAAKNAPDIVQLDGKQFAVPLGSVAFGMVYDQAANVYHARPVPDPHEGAGAGGLHDPCRREELAHHHREVVLTVKII
ncbi:putative ABC transporter substrate-binding protein YesO [compost metagenome]